MASSPLVFPLALPQRCLAVVDRSLFRFHPLSLFQLGDRLVSVALTMPSFDTGPVMFYGAYQDWKQSQKALDLTSWRGVAACDLGGDSPERLSCARMESTFLTTLGVSAGPGAQLQS